MPGRTWIALAGVALLVVALGVYRSSRTAAVPRPSAPDAVAQSTLPTLLDFGRGTCVPCRKMMPVLDALAERHAGRITVRYLDLGEPDNQRRATEMRVRIIPTQILVGADGTERDRHEGFWELDAIESRLEQLGWTPRR